MRGVVVVHVYPLLGRRCHGGLHAIHHHLHHGLHHFHAFLHHLMALGHTAHAFAALHATHLGHAAHLLHHGHAGLHHLHVLGHQCLRLFGRFGGHHFFVHGLHVLHADRKSVV